MRAAPDPLSGRLLPFVLTGILSWTGCPGGAREEIGRLLDRRAQALAGRDISRYMSCISRDYGDEGRDYEFVERNTAAYFSSPDGVEVRFSGRKIFREGRKATVYQDVTMRVRTGEGNDKVLRGRERLHLTQEGDGWKITGGLYGRGAGGGGKL